MNDIVEKINALTQKQKELLAKQFVIFSQSRMEACECFIKGFSVNDVLIHIQNTIIPEQAYARYIVSDAQQILVNNKCRLNYVNYLKNKLDILQKQEEKNNSSKEKTALIIYIVLTAKELEFYNNEINSVDLKLIDTRPLEQKPFNNSIDASTSQIAKILYNSAQQQLIIDLKLSWKEGTGIWLKGLVASLSWENAVILTNIFGTDQKYYNEIPPSSFEILWHEDELYIKIKPFIPVPPAPKHSENKTIKVISTITSVLNNKMNPPQVRVEREIITEIPADKAAYASLNNVFLYTVRRGDSLEKIAKKKLGSKARWEDIYKLNKITNINSLCPGQKLKVPKY